MSKELQKGLLRENRKQVSLRLPQILRLDFSKLSLEEKDNVKWDFQKMNSSSDPSLLLSTGCRDDT